MKSIKDKKIYPKNAILQIPLGSLKCISGYPKDKKILVELNIKELKKVNDAKTLDEIINESRLDYLEGNYKTFTNPDDLIAELKS